MHPAPSLIVFTVLSGLGFGLLAILGLGLDAAVGSRALVLYGLGYGLAGAGLVASTLHLGHPERAWRALSQWRSSWLSREGVAAIATLALMAPHAAMAVFAGQGIPILGLAGGALAVATVISTAMIYAQLKTVPRWHHWSSVAVFATAALAGGLALGGHSDLAAAGFGILGAALVLHWQAGDRRFAQAGHSPETATGLGAMGRVRLLAPPHTGRNYLLREMVHVVGRKHALRLRVIALVCAALAPALLLVAAPHSWLVTGLGLVVHVLGMFAARWLFFAEAEHVVGLYYGRR